MSIMTKCLTFQSPEVKSWALITQMKHCLKVKRKAVSQPKKCWLIIIASLLGVGHIQLEIQGEEMQRIPKTTNLECKKANTSISHTYEREEHRHYCRSRWVSTSREQEINTKEHFQEEELNKDAFQKEASKHNSYYSKYTQGVGSVVLIFWLLPVFKGQILNFNVFHPAIGSQQPSRGMNAGNFRQELVTTANHLVVSLGTKEEADRKEGRLFANNKI